MRTTTFLTRLIMLNGFMVFAACAGGGGGDAPGTPDAEVDEIDAAAPVPDGDVIDAAGIDSAAPAMIVSLEPGAAVVAHGFAQTFTLTIDQPAPVGGAQVALTSTDAGGTNLGLPASATVPEGMTTATFQVGGTAISGPFDVTASLNGSTGMATLRVVPAITGISPLAADVTVGTGGLYTITLESAAPVAIDVALGSAAATVASVPASVTVPMGATQVNFAVTGVALGGPVALTASMGGQTQNSTARVVGLFLSEVFYNPPGADAMQEWVELYNASALPIDVTGFKIESATAAAYSSSLVLAGTVPAGGCVVVGGPTLSGGAAAYFQALDMNPDLGNVSQAADGVQLTTVDGSVIDNVIYGGANTQLTPDEDGAVPANADVGDAGSDHSIERTAPGLAGPWQILLVPSPGNCTPISS